MDPVWRTFKEQVNTPFMHWWKIAESNDRLLDEEEFVTREVAFKSLFSTPALADFLPPHGKMNIPLPDRAVPVDGRFGPIPPIGATHVPSLPPSDSVVLGIIDTAIALGHDRFRKPDGSTRFLAAWQQSAPHATKGGLSRLPSSASKKALPFGNELYQADLDKLQTDHTHGDWLDEETFNEAAGLVELTPSSGNRELWRAVGHGTHMLDLAGGADPASDREIADRVPIVAVTLPDRGQIGASGSFLELFVLAAIDRIVNIADNVWKIGNVKARPEDRAGYPIVINLSYGLQTGPKDGTMLIERYVEALQLYRHNKGLSPVHLILPAGNENLRQGAATAALEKGKLWDIGWNVLPEDLTSNFVEIWSTPIADGHFAKEFPLKISVKPPEGPALALTAGQDSKYTEVGRSTNQVNKRPKFAVYCQVFEATGSKRVRFVVAAAPTQSLKGATTAAPGHWRIALESTVATHVTLGVQSDQTVGPGRAEGLESYFDDPLYVRHDSRGGDLDSVGYPDPVSTETRRAGPVTRYGTLNAIATSDKVTVAAGHQASNLRPVGYSSTGVLNTGEAAPTLSMPTDDSPYHLGVIAAGTRPGSVAVMQGTSCATAMASRLAIDALLTNYTPTSAGQDVASPRALAALARKADPDTRQIAFRKSGAGRANRLDSPKVPRR